MRNLLQSESKFGGSSAVAIAALGLMVLAGCGSSTETASEGEPTEAAAADAGWEVLLDGTSISSWNTLGDANWSVADGAVQADMGTGFLVTPGNYDNFELHAEFWTDEGANSGVFMRCDNPEMINQGNAYEVNIFDTRPDQTGRTGAIVEVAPPLVAIDTANQWNTFDIVADGNHLMVTLNGQVTVDVMDDLRSNGPIALQYGSGLVKFRNVRVREL